MAAERNGWGARDSEPATARVLRLGAIAGLAACLAGPAGAAPAGIGIECEAFQCTGNWLMEPRDGASAGRVLSSGGNGAATPAATAVRIPAAGRYTLWVRSTDFPDASPGARHFRVAEGGSTGKARFGTSGRSGWTWERGDTIQLPAGPVLIAIHDNWLTFTITVPADQSIDLTGLAFDDTEVLPAQFLLGFCTSKTGFTEGDHLSAGCCRATSPSTRKA